MNSKRMNNLSQSTAQKDELDLTNTVVTILNETNFVEDRSFKAWDTERCHFVGSIKAWLSEIDQR